jgi:hypothetical protein
LRPLALTTLVPRRSTASSGARISLFRGVSVVRRDPLLTFSGIRSRIERRLHLSRGRFVAAFVLWLLFPAAMAVPALLALALVAAAWLGLHVYELVWWREARAESRSFVTSP